MYTYSRIKNTDPTLDGLSATYQRFAVKLDGEIIGEISYDRSRWKSAGGPAWKLKRDNTVYYGSRDFQSSLKIFKQMLEAA